MPNFKVREVAVVSHFLGFYILNLFILGNNIPLC